MAFLRFIIALLLLLNYSIVNAQSDSIKKAPVDSLKLKDSTTYGVVEQMPAFIGEGGRFDRFIGKHIVYPKTLQENGITGRVMVYFIVKKDSTIQKAWVGNTKNTNPLFVNEAIRVVLLSSRLWLPGKINGRAVDVKLAVPIQFSLE